MSRSTAVIPDVRVLLPANHLRHAHRDSFAVHCRFPCLGIPPLRNAVAPFTFWGRPGVGTLAAEEYVGSVRSRANRASIAALLFFEFFRNDAISRPSQIA